VLSARLKNNCWNKHSYYIITLQNFFSLDENEVNIIAHVARYHRKSHPKKSHINFQNLTHKDKMIVMKLASILRIADSLDNTHLQLIDDINSKLAVNYAYK
jgi:exopolyphosphatase/guanosine-5'-triphosphate,3'-diphosphate pyrophosphatase